MDENNLKTIPKIKAIFSDLDNTLWDGILAEGQELTLRDDYYDFLQSLYKKGILIFFVSKNDADDVEQAIEKLGIEKDLFVTVVTNWDPKYLNVEKLIQQTILRPETVVFIDDNPLERAEVKKKLPEVAVISDQDWRLVTENEYIKSANSQPLSEIITRINRYKTALQASAGKIKFTEDKDFLRSLKRQIRIGLIDPDKLDRFTRLLVETHRINFNPDKFPEYEAALEYLHDRLNKGDELYAVSTHEGGMSLGLSGAFVIQIENEVATITDGTFSCGVMGRCFENKTLLTMIAMLKERGMETLNIKITFTQTNKSIRELVESLGMVEIEKDEKDGVVKAVYSIQISEVKPKEIFDWIEVVNQPPDLNYAGIISVIEFFDNHVKPVIKENNSVANLGSATGEVFGFEEQVKQQAWGDLMKEKEIDLKNIDLEYYPQLNNIVGNAEDLTDLIETESQDLVMAVELLEHTEHFWLVINEMIRICKVNGYIFISSPCFNYPKHEYPIDQWRIGPKTMKSFFPEHSFKIIAFEEEGNTELPRRVIALVKKTRPFESGFDVPKNGKTNWETGLTVFE